MNLLDQWPLVFRSKGEHSIYNGWLHFSPHGRYLVSRSAGSRRSLRSVWSVWNTENGECLWTLKEWVHDGLLRFHPDGESFYCIGEYSLVRYCAKSGQWLSSISLDGSKSAPQNRTFSADLSTIVSYFGDNTLWLWKVDADLNILHRTQLGEESPTSSIPSKLALSRDGAKMAFGRHDELGVLDVESLEIHRESLSNPISQLNWDGPELVVIHPDGSLTIWPNQP